MFSRKNRHLLYQKKDEEVKNAEEEEMKKADLSSEEVIPTEAKNVNVTPPSDTVNEIEANDITVNETENQGNE